MPNIPKIVKLALEELHYFAFSEEEREELITVLTNNLYFLEHLSKLSSLTLAERIDRLESEIVHVKSLMEQLKSSLN